MKKLVLSLSLALALSPAVFADGVKIQGKATCAKCDLHTSDSCRAAVVVNENGKDVTYLSEANDKSKALHKEICKGGKDATVEGTVTEKDGAKTIAISNYTLK